MNKKIFPIYKEKGPSSHDIIDEIRKITGEKRVGHAGTLDPLAEGILVVAVGRKFTKELGKIEKKEKEYIAEIKLGFRSATDDAEGKKEKVYVRKKPIKKDVLTALKKFEGTIFQVPPRFSAVKIKGIPAYRLARAKKRFNLPKRKVIIREIKLIKYKWPYLKLKIITGKGAYVRSLARDIGEKLQTGAYLNKLKRTRVGDYNIKKSLKVSQFKLLWEKLSQEEENLK